MTDDGKTSTLQLQPISFREACRFIELHHSHHRPSQGAKFQIAINKEDKIVGVIVVGRPVSRMFDNGYTAEVTRCCTDGQNKNVASKLYAAAWRAARAMGYTRLITYTLKQEKGTSLIAAGYKMLYETKGGSWNRTKRPRIDTAPIGQKLLWEIK